MGYLGIAERVYYESAHFVDGLSDIQAIVFKPDKTIAGPFTLVEAPGGFQGVYYFDYISASVDPEGNYLVKIVSPTEQIQTSYRFGLNMVPTINQQAFQDIADQITDAANEIETLVSSLASMAAPTDIKGIVESTDIFGVVSDYGNDLDGPEVVKIEKQNSESELEATVEFNSIDVVVNNGDQ